MNSFEEIAKAFLNSVKSSTDTYTSIKGEILQNSVSSFSLLTPDHIQWAYAGRAAGKAPPLAEILRFVNDKNILFDGLDERGTAFAIQQSIKRKGTKNHKPNAGDIMEETVSKYQNKYESDLGSHMLIDINNRMKDEMEAHWKEQDRLFKDFKI